MFEDIWLDYLFFFVVVFVVIYALWYAMGKSANAQNEEYKTLDFFDRHLIFIGSVFIISSIIFFAVSWYNGTIYITLNFSELSEFFYLKYDLTSPIFNIIFDFLLVSGLLCFYGHFNRNGNANKIIVTSIWKRKTRIATVILIVLGVWLIISPFFVYHNFRGWWVNNLDDDEKPILETTIFLDGNLTLTADGNIVDRNGNLIFVDDNYFILDENGTKTRLKGYTDGNENFDVDGEGNINLGNGFKFNPHGNLVIDNSGGVVKYFDYDWSGGPLILTGVVLVFIILPLIYYVISVSNRTK
jgi:hypothetical protein